MLLTTETAADTLDELRDTLRTVVPAERLTTDVAVIEQAWKAALTYRQSYDRFMAEYPDTAHGCATNYGYLLHKRAELEDAGVDIVSTRRCRVAENRLLALDADRTGL
jgi:hypothetical protein